METETDSKKGLSPAENALVEDFYINHFDELWRLASRILKDEEAAYDIVHSAFAGLIEGFYRIQDPSEKVLRSYLYVAMGLTLVLACGTMTSPVMAEEVENAEFADYYEEYDAETGTVTRIPFYSVADEVDPSVPAEPDFSDMCPFGVVGPDDSRTLVEDPSADPYSGIVKLHLLDLLRK